MIKSKTTRDDLNVWRFTMKIQKKKEQAAVTHWFVIHLNKWPLMEARIKFVCEEHHHHHNHHHIHSTANSFNLHLLPFSQSYLRDPYGHKVHFFSFEKIFYFFLCVYMLTIFAILSASDLVPIWCNKFFFSSFRHKASLFFLLHFLFLIILVFCWMREFCWKTFHVDWNNI